MIKTFLKQQFYSMHDSSHRPCLSFTCTCEQSLLACAMECKTRGGVVTKRFTNIHLTEKMSQYVLNSLARSIVVVCGSELIL